MSKTKTAEEMECEEYELEKQIEREERQKRYESRFRDYNSEYNGPDTVAEKNCEC
jgi:hypothetical protein